MHTMCLWRFKGYSSIFMLIKWLRYFRTECPCVLSKYRKSRDELISRTKAYHQAARDLVNSGRYDTRDDFTVVVQPMLENITVPTKVGCHDQLVNRTKAYHQAARDLVNSGRYDTRDDFTVVVQPMLVYLERLILDFGVKLSSSGVMFRLTNSPNGYQ